MLRLMIPRREDFDEHTNEFLVMEAQELCLEHSLVSIAKWESKWNKPFLQEERHSADEETDYIRCMTLNENVDPLCYYNLTPEYFRKINSYMELSMTATTFRDGKNVSKRQSIITAEIIYYWMIALNIPMECQYWHLNRLLALVRVCNEKNAPEKKMSRRDAYAQNRALNNARRSALHSKG